MLASHIGKGEKSVERGGGAGCWGEGGSPRWPAINSNTTTKRLTCGHCTQYCVLDALLAARTAAVAAAACFVALAASGQACVWQGRRFRDSAYVYSCWFCVLVVENSCNASRFAHTQTKALCGQVGGVGVDFDPRQPRTQQPLPCFLCWIRPRIRRSWPRAATTVAAAACFVAQTVWLAVNLLLLAAVRSLG